MALKGISFPFRKGKRSLPAEVEDESLIEESLRSIILTPVGQRVMRPRFGCNATKYVFESQSAVLRAKIRQETLRAIRNNEPRITVTRIQVEADKTKVIVTVKYVANRVAASTTVEIPRA